MSNLFSNLSNTRMPMLHILCISRNKALVELDPVSYPGFPKGVCTNLLFGSTWPENCMGMKEFGPKDL